MIPGDLGSNHSAEALKQARTEYGASQTLLNEIPLNEIPERVLRQFPVHITNWPGCFATVSRATDFSSSRPGSRPRPGPGTLPTMSGLSVRARAGDPRLAAPHPHGAGHPGRAPTGIRGREHARAGTPAGSSARRYPVALQRADPLRESRRDPTPSGRRRPGRCPDEAPVIRVEPQGEGHRIREASAAPMPWETRRPTTPKAAIESALARAHQDADELGPGDPDHGYPGRDLALREAPRAGRGRGPHSRRRTAYMKMAPGFFAFGPIACS